MPKTKITGLVGYPIVHSLSPAMFKAVYEYYDLDWSYQLFPCETNAEFHDLIAQIQNVENDFVGLNVTMPYKAEAAQAILVSGGELIETAKAINAVNCISIVSAIKQNAQTSSLIGRNVDGLGLVASLKSRSNLELTATNVLICGTGAVTAAVSVALALAGAASITVVSRHRQRALDFVDRYNKQLVAVNPQILVKGIGYDEAVALQTETHHANLLIDATPIGMYADDLALLPVQYIQPEHTVIDVVYGHGQTQLVKAARDVGAVALDGFGMLVEQAALTFEAWVNDQAVLTVFDHQKTVDIMNKAALAELQYRALNG